MDIDIKGITPITRASTVVSITYTINILSLFSISLKMGFLDKLSLYIVLIVLFLVFGLISKYFDFYGKEIIEFYKYQNSLSQKHLRIIANVFFYASVIFFISYINYLGIAIKS